LIVFIFMVVGSRAVTARAIDLADVVAGFGGFVINGAAQGDRAGLSVSDAGDVNGDGLDDVIVGAFQASPEFAREGAAYIVFGKVGTEPVSLSGIEAGSGGFWILGINPDDWAGFNVSDAGDVNGDGLDDVIVGAYFANESYVVFGKATTDSVNLQDIVAGTGGFVISGDHGQGFGAVSGAGDVNGDGRDDLIVGASTSGSAFVVFGKSNTTSVGLSNVADGIGGFLIPIATTGEPPDPSMPFDNGAVSGAGDVNGDGLDDLVVGVFNEQSGGLVRDGRSYIVFGKQNDTNPVSLSSISDATVDDPPLGYVIYGINPLGETGFSVSGAGDVNGDGLDDVIVGAPHTHPSDVETGEAFVVFGKADTAPVDLFDVEGGVGGFALLGVSVQDYTGFSVSGAGDVNGDGLDDVIVGAFGADSNSLSRTGKSFIAFGKTGTAAIDLALVEIGVGGAPLVGIDADEQSGVSVSGAGDVNGDGFADLIVGADSADIVGLNQVGRAYVVFGGLLEPMIWVDFSHLGVELGSFARPFNTLGEALAVVLPGRAISIKGDTTVNESDEILTINQPVVIQAVGGPVFVGVQSP